MGTRFLKIIGVITYAGICIVRSVHADQTSPVSCSSIAIEYSKVIPHEFTQVVSSVEVWQSFAQVSFVSVTLCRSLMTLLWARKWPFI